ncbi:glycerophosphodiester phosphodiesterase domain-containing protein 1-like [Stylophora pistillata]|uniref:glycerophosphodiester phosphodiesterase domain-containing protein 1-like n=1 Tax=Stylophora pistillata TaxID=50429 RepID=UPI000C05573A|nr:glycerophosphodiester phosphodiesterase domain-containing protein 1-like [Stylophora pistillata]
MLGWAIALPVIGTYVVTSIVLLNFPWLVHKKKQSKFRCRHISHRGGAAENLENTMTAYHHALKMGTEMLELDVRLTADKQVVVCHDDELSRVTNTDLKICDLNFTDLPPLSRTLPVQFQPGVSCVMKNNDCHIPLLDSVFEAFPNVPINVDIKTNSDLLIDKSNQDPEIPIMFSMKRCATLVFLFYSGLLPFIPIKESFLEIMLPLTMIRRFEVPRTMKILCHIVDWFLISPILFKHLDKRGIQTYLWVLNEDSEYDFAFNKLKVAGVMTDYPTRLRDYLCTSNTNPGQPVPAASGSERSELIKKD